MKFAASRAFLLSFLLDPTLETTNRANQIDYGFRPENDTQTKASNMEEHKQQQQQQTNQVG